jgi:hypothetical protein
MKIKYHINLMKIGIVVICTNIYFILGIRFIKAFVKYYTGKHKIHFYIFSDTDPKPFMPNITNFTYTPLVNKDWVSGTNSKFQSILSLESSDCEHIYYFDADTGIIKEFGDWFIGNSVGGEHFNNKDKGEKPFDRNPKSKAYVPLNTPLPQMYYYGAFFGGTKDYVINLCKILIENQKADKLIPYEPTWNDESYLNQYFHINPPSYVVPFNKFEFEISDKGGIQNTKNTTLDISNLKAIILKNPTEPFKIINGVPTFRQNGGKYRRKRVKNTRRKLKRGSK